MVTITRNVGPGPGASFDDARSLGKLMPHAINLHIDHQRSWNLVAHQNESGKQERRKAGDQRVVSVTPFWAGSSRQTRLIVNAAVAKFNNKPSSRFVAFR